MAGEKNLAIRFDLDSITCFERGVPNLLALGRRCQVRFSFFVNMGRSFNFIVNCRSRLHRKQAFGPPKKKLGLKEKLSWAGILKTVILNPPLGTKFLRCLEKIKKEGHELGLHGGMDHALWQHDIKYMNRDSVQELFVPAYEQFTKEFGPPDGFASPGFQYSAEVFDILENFNFTYASDMDGDHPFQTVMNGKRYRLWQVPVNVIGGARVPIVEEMIAKSYGAERISRDLAETIREKDFSLFYGHPYVEGVHFEILESALARLQGAYTVLSVSDYLKRWRELN